MFALVDTGLQTTIISHMKGNGKTSCTKFKGKLEQLSVHWVKKLEVHTIVWDQHPHNLHCLL